MSNDKKIIDIDIIDEPKEGFAVTSLPLISLRGLVIFPKMVLHFDVGRSKSVAALQKAMSENRLVMLSSQKDVKTDEPSGDNVYDIGVVAEIKQVVKTSNNVLRVVAEGIYRGKILTIDDGDDKEYISCNVISHPLTPVRKSMALKCEAHLRTVQELFEEYCELSPKMPREIISNVIFEDDYVQVAQYIAGNLPVPIEDKQKILAESSPIKRLAILAGILDKENELLSLEREIYDKVKEQIDKNQRDYYLREQIKAISAELNEGESPMEESQEYIEKIIKLNLSNEHTEKLVKEANRIAKMSTTSPEAGVVRNYLDNVLSLPWNESTQDKIDIEKAKNLLDKEHYGMDKVKERILELLAVRVMSPDIKGQIICLVGPPGVGKTSIAKSIAKSMGRKYSRMSLGGVRDESDIRGHRKTYIGAMPGRIINALKQAKSNNPLILLDEIDKLGSDFRGDPSSALLEVLDSEQNTAFVDHYIEIPFDLSDTLFIATANNLSTIPGPLLDRMEVIHLSSYTREEKFNIAKSHLIPKQLKKHGLKPAQFKFAKAGLYGLIDSYTKEAGVRTLEREIASCARKAVKEIVSENAQKITVDMDKLSQYMGPKKFREELISKKNEIGVVNGLAWTSVGGALLPVEIAVLEGTGKIELTGNLGNVMKESARIAVSYVRSTYEKFGIDKDFYKTKDIHIHAPEGEVPKDGPSAGINMTTALVSALNNTPVKRDVAMTGEVSLRGRVMAIGGLKEKTMAAYSAGVKTVIIPDDNVKDLYNVDKVVKDAITFISATDMNTVLDNALVFSPKIVKGSQIEYNKTAQIETPIFDDKAKYI